MKFKDSVTFSGGASQGLGYFKPLLEAEAQNLTFSGKYIGMTSAGIVMWTPYLCGYSVKELRNMLVMLGGDDYMKEKPHPAEIWHWAKNLKRTFNKDCIETAKKHFTWEKMLASGRLADGCKPMIGICKFVDILRVLKVDLTNGIGDGKFIPPWIELMNGNPQELIKHVGFYWFSYDGTYKYDVKSKKIVKVSKKVTPLWQVFMAGFSNVRFTGETYRLHFDRCIRQRAFDQGLIMNKGNLLDDDLYSIACVPYNKTVKMKDGLKSISDYVYSIKKAVKERTAFPSDHEKDVAFYDFSGDRVRREYERAKESYHQDRYFL